LAKGNVIVGLDVGTSKTAAAVGAIGESGGVDLVGFGLSPNAGMRKGQVVDLEECTSSISGALEEAERTSGTPLTEAVVNVSGPSISILESRGLVAVARADGDITGSDVERAVDAARAVSVPRNQEVLHIIPREFIVDGQGGIKDPTGMNGVRLEASGLLRHSVEVDLLSGFIDTECLDPVLLPGKVFRGPMAVVPARRLVEGEKPVAGAEKAA